jgi:probable HAF family extracellular repeat protein
VTLATRARAWRAAASAAAGFAVCWAAAPSSWGQAPAPVEYDVVDLGFFAVPSGLNDVGQIAGTVGSGSTAILWQDGQWTAPGPVPPGGRASGSDVNNSGQVAGAIVSNNGPIRAALWQGGTRVDLGTLVAPALADELRIESNAFGLDDAGRVVGESQTFEGYPPAGCDPDFYCPVALSTSRAFLWEGGTMSPLPSLVDDFPILSHYDCEVGSIDEQGEIVPLGIRSPCSLSDSELEVLIPSPEHPDGLIPVFVPVPGEARALDVNGSGQVVGRAAAAPGENRAVLWQGGSITDLGPGEAHAINASGQIVGISGSAAFSRQPGGPMTNLPHPPGCFSSSAEDVNGAGLIVGYSNCSGIGSRAVLWQGGSAKDLNDSIDPGSGWVLARAHAINERGQIIGWGAFNGGGHGFLLTPRRPVLVIPGIAGTFAADEDNLLPWSLARGADPDALQLDPLARVYHDVVQTLKNVGYVEGKTLFVVKYDWRLMPGPEDGVIDGQISGLSAAGISDTAYSYAVDYLGEALFQAAEQWREDHLGQPLEAVDVIAHSTGGLVARTYIQSAAYGAAYSPAGDELPEIHNLIMLGVPNRGASKAWNPTQDNWVIDASFKVVLAKLLDLPYQKVVHEGAQISGPDQAIDLASIQDAQGNPDPLRFIHQYVPTIRGLLATYDFLDCSEGPGVPGVFGCGSGFTDVNDNPALRNSLVLDLNAGLDFILNGDPNAFADRAKVSVIYGVDQTTPTSVKQRVGVASGEDAIAPFTDFAASDAVPGQVWYDDQLAPLSGDGTVPIDSSAGQFLGDPRVTRHPFAGVDHVELMFNADTQKRILDTLGVHYQDDDISTDLHAPYASQLYNATDVVVPDVLVAVLDPVEGFVVDANGNRLGYSAATGRVSEIPGSFWLGDGDGIGWVFGSLAKPLSLQLSGLGGRYYASVGVISQSGSGGVELEGVLAPGEPRIAPIPVQPPDRDGDGIADPLDRCPHFASPDQGDTDGDGRGNPCECTDQNGDGRNTVADLVAINLAIFNPGLVTPLCDGNGDGLCNVNDLIAANVEIFSPTNTSVCARQPVPGP